MKRKPFNHKLGKDDHGQIMKMLAAQTPVYVIAKKLRCDRHVLADYIRSHEELLAAHNDREEAFKDTVEYELRRKIVVEHNLNAMMFYADRRMRDRGYGEHIENENKDSFDGAVAFGEIPDDELPTVGAEEAGDEKGTVAPPMPEPVPKDELPDEGEPKGMF